MEHDIAQALKILHAAIAYTTDRTDNGVEDIKLYEELEDAVFAANPAAVESLARKRRG